MPTPTLLTSGSDTTAASNYQTAIISPTAGNLILVFVYNSKASPAIAPTSVKSYNTLDVLLDTWTQETSRDFDTDVNPAKILSVWRHSTTTGSGYILIDFNAVNQSGCMWFVVEVSGVDTTVNNGVGASATGFNDTAGTSALVPSVGSGSAFRIGMAATNSNPAGTGHHSWAEAGWTEITGASPGEQEISTPDAVASIGYNSSDTDLGTTVTTPNDRYGSINLQITAAAADTLFAQSVM